MEKLETGHYWVILKGAIEPTVAFYRNDSDFSHFMTIGSNKTLGFDELQVLKKAVYK